MSDEQAPNGRVTTRQVYELGDRSRIEWRVEFEKLNTKVDAIKGRQDRIDGALGMLKWLGPTGVIAVIAGLLRG